MANSYVHAQSSVRQFGGKLEWYQPVHDWFDRTKSAWADTRHRAVLHHDFGIKLAVERFGSLLGSGKDIVQAIPVYEQHVQEDCSFIPTVDDWIRELPTKDWFDRAVKRGIKTATHSVTSARRFGGQPQDYFVLHEWFDRKSSPTGDVRDRAILHHAYGIFLGEERFGHSVENSAGKRVPVRIILEQHVIEEYGFIPTIADWFTDLPRTSWMIKGALPLSRILANLEAVAS